MKESRFDRLKIKQDFAAKISSSLTSSEVFQPMRQAADKRFFNRE